MCGILFLFWICCWGELVTLYMDFKLDESYTPSKISIWTGDSFQNLKAQKLGFKICLIENRSGVHVHNQAVTPSTTWGIQQRPSTVQSKLNMKTRRSASVRAWSNSMCLIVATMMWNTSSFLHLCQYLIYLPKFKGANLKKTSRFVRKFLTRIRQKMYLIFLRLHCNTSVSAIGSFTIKFVRPLMFDLLYKSFETCPADRKSVV